MLAAPTHVLPRAALLIGDQRLTDTSAGWYDHIYAANGKVTASVPLAGAREVDLAVRAARSALPAWRALPAGTRRSLLLRLATLLRERRSDFATVFVIDNGAPLAAAKGTPARTADLFEYHAGWADKISGEVVPAWPRPALDYTTREPFGVVAIMSPWNGPLLSLGTRVAPALAAGNTVVLKPSEIAPWSALALGELCGEAGFPPGVVNVIPSGPEGGAALVRHRGVDKVHFTGSGATAKHVLAGARENLTPVGLELGGKSANVIFGDADLPRAVSQAISAVTVLSGQACISGSRVLVEASVYDEVVAMTADALAAKKMGDPLDPSTVMGPVVNQTAVDRILSMIDRAKGSSARLVLGGERLGGDLSDGYFVAPTIFADVDNHDDLARHEVFGPVLSMLRFETEAEAVAIANDTSYGLAGYLWTNDLQRAHRVAAALETGIIWVNGFDGIPAGAPFGGVKQSGHGRLGGIDAIREFSYVKNVWIGL